MRLICTLLILLAVAVTIVCVAGTAFGTGDVPGRGVVTIPAPGPSGGVQ